MVQSSIIRSRYLYISCEQIIMTKTYVVSYCISPFKHPTYFIRSDHITLINITNIKQMKINNATFYLLLTSEISPST